MSDLISRQAAIDTLDKHLRTTDVPVSYPGIISALTEWLNELPSAQADSKETSSTHKALDTISRQAVIEINRSYHGQMPNEVNHRIWKEINELPSAQADLGKYEYHYDHTDCIWYRPEAMNRCPVTCAQYRDGWNDAMNYIFRDGKGYRPYRRGEQYEE